MANTNFYTNRFAAYNFIRTISLTLGTNRAETDSCFKKGSKKRDPIASKMNMFNRWKYEEIEKVVHHVLSALSWLNGEIPCRAIEFRGQSLLIGTSFHPSKTQAGFTRAG